MEALSSTLFGVHFLSGDIPEIVNEPKPEGKKLPAQPEKKTKTKSRRGSVERIQREKTVKKEEFTSPDEMPF